MRSDSIIGVMSMIPAVGNRLPYLVCCSCISDVAVTFPGYRWRFSLRTLLIAMTLVAVVLGLIVAFAG